MEDGKKFSSSFIPSFARGLNILLVDHDTTSLMDLSSMLEQYTYKVTTTEQASVALSMVEEQKDRFKLVMANTKMPDMNNLEFLNMLLEKNIPVILISSESSVEAAMKAIAEGASFYLEKPIAMDDLKYVWQHAYNKKRSQNGNSSQQEDQIIKEAAAVPRNAISEDKQIEKNCTKESENNNNMVNEDNNTKGKTKIIEEENNKENKRKPRILWTPDLHLKFTAAISALGDKKARPKPILEVMNVPHLTQRQVASHLQKYKSQVQRIFETGMTNLPAVSKSSNFYGRTRLLETLEKNASAPVFHLGAQTSNHFGFRAGEITTAPLNIKNQVLVTSTGTTPNLDSVRRQFISGNNLSINVVNFPTDNSIDGNQKLNSMEVFNTNNSTNMTNADDFLVNFDDWNEELDLMQILTPTTGEVTKLDNILPPASIDSNQEKNVMENLNYTSKNINGTVVSEPPASSINHKYYSDLVNMLEEEPAACSSKYSSGEPNPGDVERYCEWLTNVLNGNIN